MKQGHLQFGHMMQYMCIDWIALWIGNCNNVIVHGHIDTS